MNENKLGTDFILVEVLIKMAALEKVLVNKGIITQDDFAAEVKEVSDRITAAANQAKAKMQADIAKTKENAVNETEETNKQEEVK